ncbi:Holliday junction branch migration protein RuvA [Halobacteriovorax sp. HLS]|uniref:Holliday junction branch migration protein RuvA n=1 Tax=Halobacteriovorax sp. HLS TaxID=2234000 RepID=UPI000FDC0B19|nr:Holliday junction branch migration protein RuvA [Halobacteriovorax sp. HLS]
MIGHLQGEVLFSDGVESVILTNSGIGYQVYFHQVLPEGNVTSIFISHVIREASEELYGFRTIREKKMFELLTSVKGVGPKSAFSLASNIGVDQIINAITMDDKKTLTKAPGIGAKAAAQMILDLQNKVSKIKMYSNKTLGAQPIAATSTVSIQPEMFTQETEVESTSDHLILNDTILACKELGFKEEKVIPIAQKILGSNEITKPEQLIHLVLREV